jgi:paraquat-inducible protein B
MNKKISPTLIGAFVVGALALVVIAVLMFGSGRFFRTTKEFVLYFDGSVNGLRVGAPVKFRGVEIGSVKKILLRLEKDPSVLRIPVVIELELKKFTSKGATGAALQDPEELRRLIASGLRGQLQMESFVTGLLFVGIDYFPDSKLTLVQQPGVSNEYPEIPTEPTTLQIAGSKANEIIAKLDEIDFKGIVASFERTAKGIEALVTSPELKETVRSSDELVKKLETTAVNIAQLAQTFDAKTKLLSDDFQLTTAEARSAIKQAGAAFEKISSAISQAQSTLKETEGAMANLQNLTEPDSPTFYEITKALKEVSGAARSLRLLASYVERNPRALVFGKPETKEE